MYGTELHAEQKPVEEKILQVLQVLKNTEVKGKIKTKTVSEPVAFQGQDSLFHLPSLLYRIPASLSSHITA